VALLGATGSIGRQALEVIDRFPERFEVLGLVTGSRPADRAARFVICAREPDADARMEELVTHPDCDLVLVAIPTARALAPTLAARAAGKRLAIATKEVLVMAGELVMAGTTAGDVIRPIDSEHSAIWQCLWGEAPASISKLVLTATGGPFWGRPDRDLSTVTVAEALNHPRWSMGPKVTIDSATMMNKGLEVIEAHHLFQVPLDRVEVMVHPQAIVHSMVRFVDGSAKAQLSHPDMRLPIALGLSYPERLPGAVPPTRFERAGSLELHSLDTERFPSVGLARLAAARGAPFPAVLNAANEVAVAAFLEGRIGFKEIVSLVESALAAFPGAGGGATLPEIMAADAVAREHVAARVGKVMG
jgi:1-deoxy-D-xylulose-5-phosphate reductoisomerase